MRVLVQWTQAKPQDWISVDSSVWSSLPFKIEPVGGEVINNTPGWIYGIAVQGCYFNGFDHYHVADATDGIVVTTWNDDSDDYPPGMKYGMTYTMPIYKFDGRIGKYNTVWKIDVYAEALVAPQWNFPAEARTLHDWSAIKWPDDAAVRHGIWVTGDLASAYERIRTPISWHTWTEGVPTEFVKDGRVI